MSNAPFFLRKKFLKYYGLFVVLLLLAGIVLTAFNYFKAKEEGRVRWEYITVPLTLPIVGLTGYALLFPFWLVYKAKQMRNEAFSKIPDMFTPPAIVLPSSEVQYGYSDQVNYIPPGGNAMLGEIRFTNRRVLFIKSIDLKRLTAPLGTQKPEITSIPLHEIRQCGFGLREQRPKDFMVITNTGEAHRFTSIAQFNATTAFTQLGWKPTQVNDFTYWVR